MQPPSIPLTLCLHTQVSLSRMAQSHANALSTQALPNSMAQRHPVPLPARNNVRQNQFHTFTSQAPIRPSSTHTLTSQSFTFTSSSNVFDRQQVHTLSSQSSCFDDRSTHSFSRSASHLIIANISFRQSHILNIGQSRPL